MDQASRISPAATLASALLVTLAACGGGAQASPTPVGAGATATPAAATATSTATAPTPPASEAAMQVMGKGELHHVDGSASGIAELVALPGGAYEVILDTFAIDSVAHTDVVLVANTDVTKTADIDKSKLLDLGPLKGTSGMQTYAIPADMASAVTAGYHSVVIWDTEMAHAIAAAPLR